MIMTLLKRSENLKESEELKKVRTLFMFFLHFSFHELALQQKKIEEPSTALYRPDEKKT